MELRHIRYFVAVAEELSFRKASQRLRVSQPALSKQIMDLESELGVQLFDRNRSGVRLTEAGATFLVEARLTLAQSVHAVTRTREAAKGFRGRLTVGYVEPVLMGFMTATLRAFRQKFPNVDVTLSEMPLANQVAAVESGILQVGFAIGGTMHFPRCVLHVEIACSPIRAVMARSHPLARLRQMSLADLLHVPLLCLSLKKEVVSMHTEMARSLFANRKLKGISIRQIEGTEAFRAAIESGLGVSLIPEIGGISQTRSLTSRPLQDTGADLCVELLALWRDAPTSPNAANFIAVMRHTLATEKRG
ncbi:MAG: LysR family transcriptional regulator [Ramlibacter sp.]|nr:LysR family transcriptional regulator [Ramlibacter sp.]